ncbi:MAG: DUF4203 domain-containing protein [Acidobacteriota bacterium]
MQQIFANYNGTHVLAISLGVVLLIFGRKLYWLALGGIGFFLGLWLADQVLDMRSTGLELGIGFLMGILGAYLVSAAQRVAIGLGGFVVGGAMAYWVAAWLAVPLQWQPGAWLWIAGMAGAILGTMVAALLFDASLVALSSLIGALLLSRASQIGQPHESWLFLILVLIGMMAQSGQHGRRHHGRRHHSARATAR